MFFFKKLLSITILLIVISVFFSFCSIEQVNAAETGGTLARLVQRVKDILNLIIELLFVLATVYFMWGVVAYIAGAGDTEKLKIGKQHMVWGLVGMAIMLGAWGLVEIIKNFMLGI